ncbi:MAG: NfeD family protein [Calditrichia bacterium]
MQRIHPSILLILTVFGSLFSQVYHITIEGTIDLGLPPYIERVVELAEEDSAEALILEINTFGGRVDAATQIKDILLDAKIPTIAYVNKRAISAGALIGLSCKTIAMAPGSSLGAATVVDLQGKKAPEKAMSYFRAEMGATAERNGRNRQIAEAMVDEDIEIDSLTEKGKLVTLTAEDALKWKMADFIAENLDAVLDSLHLENQKLVRVETSWAEDVVRFLTHPMVSSLLMSLGLLGLFFEIKSPGWGIPGTIGIILLMLFFGSHYIVTLASVIEIALFLIGIGLLLLEIFVIPGFGIAGIAGIISVILGLYLSLLGNFKYLQFEDYTSAAGHFALAMIITFVGVVVLLKHFPGTSVWKKIALSDQQKKERGFVSTSRSYDQYLGAEGVALTPLRPAGIAIINNERLDVVTEGEFIEKGAPIKIIRVEGFKLIAQKKEEEVS